MNSALHQLFAHLQKRVAISEEQFSLLAKHALPMHLKKKETFLSAGEVGKYQGYIVNGCMRAFFTDDKAHEHVVQLAFEDWWIADIASFYTGAPASYTIEALEDTDLLVFDRANIDELFDQVPSLERHFRVLIQNAYIQLQARMLSNMSQSAEERYLSLTKKYPHLELRVAQHHIASFLGITPEALSRIRKSIIEKQKKLKA